MNAIAATSRYGPLDLLIIQPTPFCNLDCDYCYLPMRQSREKIQPEVLRAIFKRVFSSSIVDGKFTVVWHAGEPLVLPIDFYRDALRIIAEENTRGVEVTHSFQTNGTLLTPEWCDFLKETGMSIGVSVDGPAFIHDRHRKTRSGRGTWDQVVRGIDLLREHGVPFHTITVLTGDAMDYPDELFEFFVEHEVRQIAFNVEEIEGSHVTSSLSGSAVQERYYAFLTRFLDLVGEAPERISVREFDYALTAIAAKAPPRTVGPQLTTPFAIVSVDCHGNFSTFSPELLGLSHGSHNGFIFGNVMTDSIEAALESHYFQSVEQDVRAGIEKCSRTCEYFQYCGGGSPVNKLFENGSFDSTETLFCKLSCKASIDVVLSKIESQASLALHA